MTAAAEPTRLTDVFDEQVQSLPDGAPEPQPPHQVLTLVQRLLDGAAEAIGEDATAMLALESVRSALSVLNAVTLRQAALLPNPGRWVGLRRQESRAGFGPAEPLVDAYAALDAARNALEVADRLRATAVAPPPETGVRPWAEDDELVDLLHDLISAGTSGRGELALAKLDHLREVLVHHGIEAVDHGATDTRHFDRVQGVLADESTTHTLRPALLRDGALLRPGMVRVPKEG